MPETVIGRIIQSPQPAGDAQVRAPTADEERLDVVVGRVVAGPPSLQEKSQEVFGLDPEMDRAAFLPFGRNEEGELEFAFPQILADLAESSILPGHAAQGGSFTPEDVTRFALDFAVPLTARGSFTGGKKPVSQRQFAKNAPSVEGLKAASKEAVGVAQDAGISVKPETTMVFLGKLSTKLQQEGVDRNLHPKVVGALKAATERFLGRGKQPNPTALSVDDLNIMRRQFGVAAQSNVRDERRLAKIAIDAITDFGDNLGSDDVLAGTPEGVGLALKKHRALWSLAMKAEEIAKASDRAKSSASGLENGLRIEFRKLLRDEKFARRLTADEKTLIENIVKGKASQRILRTIGKLSFGRGGGSNFLGGTIGVGAGGIVGGPIGAMAAPAIGAVAQRGAERAALRNADLVRATVAQGGKLPEGANLGGLMGEFLRTAPPAAGTQVPRPEIPSSLVRALLASGRA